MLVLILIFVAIISGIVGEWARHLFFRSRPAILLLMSTLILIGITIILPYLPFISVFGFVPLPAPLMLAMLGLMALYVLATEVTNKFFYSRMENAVA